jgi:hypothetical protein
MARFIELPEVEKSPLDAESTPAFINIDTIAFITEAPNGTEIYFIGKDKPIFTPLDYIIVRNKLRNT